jgi:hypothetical protein
MSLVMYRWTGDVWAALVSGLLRRLQRAFADAAGESAGDARRVPAARDLRARPPARPPARVADRGRAGGRE